MYKIREVSLKSNVSVRMLRYYDKIGLLNPSSKTQSGYRLYDEGDLETLINIQFYRALDFSLGEIKEIMKQSSPDVNTTLSKHKTLLKKKVERLNIMISTIEEINNRGGGLMDMTKLMDMGEITAIKEKYEKEVKDRYQSTDAYKESMSKTKNYTAEDWQKIMQESEAILKDFFNNSTKDVESEVVQALVGQWKNHITKYYYKCDNDILAGLGLMYTSDQRFKKNMDKYGAGTAEFVGKAIQCYCK